MLEESGRRAHLGGNIGDPLIGRLSDIRPEDVCVVELSSFQLNYFGSELDANPGGDLAAPLFPAGGWSPPTAAVLNVTPNHLDRHPSMSDYAAAKLRILQHQGEYDLAVLNWDDPVTRAFAAHCPGKTAFFSLSEEVACGAYLRRGQLTLRRAEKEVVVCLVGDVRLRGMHNVANVLAACAVTHSLGVTPAQMAKVARTFEGVEHRLEVVRQLQGVWYVNDSIATSPERAIAALRSFDEPIVLLAGGRDKHLPWGEWAELAGRKATHIVVFGEAAALIEGQLSKLGKGAPPVLQADDLAQAVELARTVARPGDVVLFSPGGTSFDAFDDYAERGRVFRNLVAELPGGARGTVAHEQRGQR